jgi:hypothetical protein
MFTTAKRDTILGTLGGFIGLIKTITDWRAGTVTEAAYTGYGTRPAVTWGAATDSSPAGARQVANSGAVTFPKNTGVNEDQIAWGVYAASTGGSPQLVALIDDDQPFVGVGNVDDTIDAFAHGLATDQRVFVLAAAGAVMPTGLAENTPYFVLASGLTADVFKLSTSSGGAAVNITVGGAAQFIPYKAQTVATNATPDFANGQLVVQL